MQSLDYSVVHMDMNMNLSQTEIKNKLTRNRFKFIIINLKSF